MRESIIKNFCISVIESFRKIQKYNAIIHFAYNEIYLEFTHKKKINIFKGNNKFI